MSQENVEIVRRAYERVTASLELPLELYHQDMVLDARDVSPDFGVVRGREASQESLRGYWKMFDGYHAEMGEVIQASETSLVNSMLDHGRMRGSEAEIGNRYFHVWTFAEGRILRLSIHSDRNRALAAVGLAE
jgi:ketosteroid isomerase-like protein